MMSKLSRLIVAFLVSFHLGKILEGAPPGRDPGDEKIEHLAEVYKINGKDAATKFKALRELNSKRAREAAAYFEQAKAYEIAALAFPEIKDQYIRDYLRSVISRKKDFNPVVCQAALHELELLNAENLGRADGEHIAAVANMKEELAEAIARWLAVPAPKLPHDPDKSAPGYKVFLTEARRKAATITASSPD